ncbi:MAG: LamG domain-containing protein, partial [Woeseia sp.]
SLDIPPGATISNAYLQFQVDEATTASANLVVRAQAADDAGTFSASNYNLSSRPLSTAAVNWSPVGWPAVGDRGEDQRTPDLSAIIQEIVDRPGWASGNALVIVIDGTGTRIAESYEGDPAGAATLHIEYGGGSGEPPATQKVLFVVGDVSMTAAEMAHKALLESWGYSVELIDDGASQADFNAAVSSSNVVFLTNDVTASSVGSKLVGATIGVVTSEDNLSDEFGISSGIAWESGTAVTIDNNSHYITSPFSTGSLTIFSSGESLAYLTGSLAPDLKTLASSSSGFGIVALEAGAALYSSGTAAGRRVQLPWGGNGFDPGQLTAEGRTLLRRAIEWGAGATSTSNGPLAHWRFDETSGSIAVDSVGGHDGTLVNGTLWASGVFGGAVSFDGVNDYVDLTSDTALDNVFDGGATVTAWVNPATWGENNYGRILDKDDSLTAPGNGWAIEFDGVNRWLLLQQGFTAAGGEWAIPKDAVALNKWQHVGIVYDSGSAANDPLIYIDGVAQVVTERRTPSGTSTSDDTLALRLGNYSLASSRTFKGSIDDVQIHDRMLDASEVAALAVSGGGGGGGGGGGCNGAYRDEFSARTYSGSDGTLTWAGDWIEVGESD